MACATANVKFRLRRDTANEWATTTTILMDGEPGFDTTNNILKIGNASKSWDQLPRANFDLFGIPLAPTNLSLQTSTNVSKTFSWTYPLQTQTGFSSSKLPLITQFNAEIIHDGGTVTLPSMPAATESLVLNMTTGTSGSSGTTYIYYDTIFQTVLVNPNLRIWYSNYSTEPPNKASTSVGAFSVPKGYPSAVRNLSANLIRNRMVVTYDPPAFNNSLVPGDSVALDSYYYIIETNLATLPLPSIPADTTFFVYNPPVGQTAVTVSITAYNTYATGDISSGAPVYSTEYSFTVNANLNAPIEETALSLAQTPYDYLNTPAVNDMIYYRRKFRSYTALDSRVKALLDAEPYENSRYTTFAFTVSNLPSGLRIILKGVEGGIDYVNQLTSSALKVGGIMPGVYYRFVSSGGTYPNYSSRWISANTTSPQDVSSSEYNNSSVSMYNGLISTTYGSDITFNVFAPNIVPSDEITTTLFVTVKTYEGQNMSFSHIEYN